MLLNHKRRKRVKINFKGNFCGNEMQQEELAFKGYDELIEIGKYFFFLF